MSYSRVPNKLSKKPGLKLSNTGSLKIITNIIKSGEYRFTNDGIFAIKPVKPAPVPGYIMTPEFQTTSDYLYIRNDYKIDPNTALYNLINNGFIIKTNTVNLTMKKGGLDIIASYDEYMFNRPLIDERTYDINGLPINDAISINENDCLKFGECLTFANQTLDKSQFDTMLKAPTNPPVLQSNISNKPFGATEYDEDNIKILKTIPPNEKNNFAVPKNGDSYAIVRKKIISNSAPYHIAFVLYTGNNVNITLEAEADNRNYYQPKFCFYDINPNGNTFHRRWSGELYKNATDEYGKSRYNTLYSNGETIVLKSRNISDVIKEMDYDKLKKSPNSLIRLSITKKTKGGRIYKIKKKRYTLKNKKVKSYADRKEK